MKKNIILSCSQQSWNKCIVCGSEEEHTYLVAEKAAARLRAYDCNVFVISKDISGTENETLSKVVSASNNIARSNPGQSYHLDIHTDGGYKGKGASGFYMSVAGCSFISEIHREVSSYTPWADGGVSERSLYVLRETDAVAGLIELSFHDDAIQAKHIHDNLDGYAQAIVNGIVNALGLVRLDFEHWAEPHWKFLNDNGIKINEKRFDEPITRGETFKLLGNLYAHLDK